MKKRQLMELAIINGTYRDSSTKAAAAGEFCVYSQQGYQLGFLKKLLKYRWQF